MQRTRLPSITTLTAFEAAARHMSFRRAADELHLTQGAVGQQVRQLEEQLGLSLFQRVRQRVVLTQAGMRYLEEVQRILHELGEATHQAMASGDMEILNIACVPTFATLWLVPRLPDFLARHPGINVNLVSRSAPFDFLKEPFDAAIHYGEPAWSGAVVTPLMPEDMVPVCSTAYRRRHRLRMPADLERATLLQQFTRPSAWQDWFRHVGVEPAQAFQGPRFDSFNMILAAVRANMGAALLPRFMVLEDMAQRRIVQLSPHGLPSTRGYHLAHPEARGETAAVAALRTWLLGQVIE